MPRDRWHRDAVLVSFGEMTVKNEKRVYAEEMLTNYLTCAEWADLDDDYEKGLDFSPCAEESALADCLRFVGINWEMIKEVRPDQVGHDLWLTRNRYGAGFWDRPEIYGSQDIADHLTESAHSFGELSVFVFCGKLIIE